MAIRQVVFFLGNFRVGLASRAQFWWATKKNRDWWKKRLQGYSNGLRLRLKRRQKSDDERAKQNKKHKARWIGSIGKYGEKNNTKLLPLFFYLRAHFTYFSTFPFRLALLFFCAAVCAKNKFSNNPNKRKKNITNPGQTPQSRAKKSPTGMSMCVCVWPLVCTRQCKCC